MNMDGKKFDIWLYGKDVGWWLQEEGYYIPEHATNALCRWLKDYEYLCGGAVLPAGTPIDFPFGEDVRDD